MFYSLAVLVRKILFLLLESKIQVFSPTCNTLFIFNCSFSISIVSMKQNRNMTSGGNGCRQHKGEGLGKEKENSEKVVGQGNSLPRIGHILYINILT